LRWVVLGPSSHVARAATIGWVSYARRGLTLKAREPDYAGGLRAGAPVIGPAPAHVPATPLAIIVQGTPAWLAIIGKP
jgi:hypothetical protein